MLNFELDLSEIFKNLSLIQASQSDQNVDQFIQNAVFRANMSQVDGQTMDLQDGTPHIGESALHEKLGNQDEKVF